ncbi:hypothetical protein DAERI_020425 [Deinococcus aerius]|uniref:Uncharacterized protein n=2 Tax=Deinococcus TaxID=1298 RepID=A0A2I9DFJ4_9DEIO|nr:MULTISPECIES: hypothetical protein [Deinococcus]MBB5293725.1 hypothetical protein [Deinococcus metallilatus]QBY07310.1 hypothetical protein E5F05_04845 [Deinococcus metallilatus]RXJ14783.1 hypothetical protein ERJ73_03570 [Deinococcus metallilatus]TLK30903.1 hypothetical protein FCS05_03885 [Deinococcus metallilatus]GBF04828.1 hypothetical protein DAERI_020425 [Deinococcus aerius]
MVGWHPNRRTPERLRAAGFPVEVRERRLLGLLVTPAALPVPAGRGPLRRALIRALLFVSGTAFVLTSAREMVQMPPFRSGAWSPPPGSRAPPSR